MKTKNFLIAVVAIFVSLSVMTAQVPAKKDAKAEPVKKECVDKKADCKDAKKADCKDAKAQCDGTKKAECKDAKAGECKDKKTATAATKSACCDKKDTAQAKK